MAEVGVRELKARLSEHLRRAQAGERLIVTDRGRPIATLGPPEESAKPAHPGWLLQLAAEGRVTLPTGGKPLGMNPRVKSRGLPASQAVIEDRG